MGIGRIQLNIKIQMAYSAAANVELMFVELALNLKEPAMFAYGCQCLLALLFWRCLSSLKGSRWRVFIQKSAWLILLKGEKVNLRILHDQLIRQIQRFGNDARENRQVHSRLSQLLPDRFKEMASRFRRNGLGPADSSRAALASEELIAHIDEIIEVGASGLAARIQYETHMMLVDARKSLRTSKIR